MNSEDQDGSTALDYAAWNGSTLNLIYFKEVIIMINRLSICFAGHEQVVNVLFNHGATVDHVDHVRGMTALQISANRGKLIDKNSKVFRHLSLQILETFVSTAEPFKRCRSPKYCCLIDQK